MRLSKVPRTVPRLLPALAFSFSLPATAMQDIELRPLSPLDWELVTDRVMGGVSRAQATATRVDGRDCTRLSGAVSTENRGGFVQIAADVGPAIAAEAAGYEGLAFEVHGNGEDYKLHLRTTDLWLPWQSYRAGFRAVARWQTIRLPFAAFEPHRIVAPLRVERLRRIGVVAIGREFQADVCVAGLSLYRRP